MTDEQHGDCPACGARDVPILSVGSLAGSCAACGSDRITPSYPRATTSDYFETLAKLHEQWQAERTDLIARIEALERRCDANGIYE